MKQINWGILGAAKIAVEQVIPAMIKSENANLLAISSRDIKKATNYVVSAINNLIKQKPIEPSQTAAYGCSIKYNY